MKIHSITIIIYFVLVSGCVTSSITKYDNYNIAECYIPNPTELAGNYVANLEEISKFSLGSFCNPVKSRGPSGQREYLSRLICKSGQPPIEFRRLGSFGPGPYGNTVDGYIIHCKHKFHIEEYTIYMDLYHDHRELKPIEAFAIRKDDI